MNLEDKITSTTTTNSGTYTPTSSSFTSTPSVWNGSGSTVGSNITISDPGYYSITFPPTNITDVEEKASKIILSFDEEYIERIINKMDEESLSVFSKKLVKLLERVQCKLVDKL